MKLFLQIESSKLGPISPSEFIEIAEKTYRDIERCLLRKDIISFLS